MPLLALTTAFAHILALPFLFTDTLLSLPLLSLQASSRRRVTFGGGWRRGATQGP
jgi:hypothetical protein